MRKGQQGTLRVALGVLGIAVLLVSRSVAAEEPAKTQAVPTTSGIY